MERTLDIVPPPVHLHAPPPHSKYAPQGVNNAPDYNPNTPFISVVYPNPRSVTIDPWTSFGKFQNKSFTEEFCHENDITVKVAGDTFNGGRIMLKESLNFDNKKLQIKDNVKILFPFNFLSDSSLRVNWTNDHSSFHFDNGTRVMDTYKVNLYGSIGVVKDWSKYNLKLGASVFRSGLQVNNRLKIQKNRITWYHKLLYRTKNLRFGFIGVLNLSEKELLKNDFLVGYYKDGVDVSLRTQQDFSRRHYDFNNLKGWFNQIILTTTYRHSLRLKYGFQAVQQTNAKGIKILGLAQYLFDRNLVKAKLDDSMVLTLVVKNQMSQNFTLLVGTRFPLVKKTNKDRMSFGIQTRFNI